MAVDKPEFGRMIKEQIKNERKAAMFLRDSAKKANNKVIQSLLYRLALESEKHDHMLRAILQLLEFPRVQFKSESEEFQKIIEKHVEIEAKMLEDLERIVEVTEDGSIRFIIQDIISDEKKHHAITKRMHDLICERKKVKDEKWWDFLFRYSRLTG